MIITTERNVAGVAQTVADLFVAAAADAISKRGQFFVALSGGTTPRALYEVLRRPQVVELIDWTHVSCFFSDERMVPVEHPDSNLGLGRQELFIHLSVPPVVYAPTINLARDEAARQYEAVIREHVSDSAGMPTFDFIILGIGSDGHTASLFPGYNAALEARSLVVGTEPGSLPPPVDRLSFTLPLINAARRVVIMAAGPDKQSAVHDLLSEIEDPITEHTIPAARVRPQSGALEIVVDAAAAGESL